MIRTLEEGELVLVTVREGNTTDYIAGREGEYIHIDNGDFDSGETVVIEITNKKYNSARGRIIEDPDEVDKDLLDWSTPEGEFPKLKRHLQQVNPYDFEDFIAELWEQMGWETRSTSGSGDGGVDVVAIKRDPVQQKHLIQVKRYGKNNTLGVNDVRDYGYLLDKQDGDKGIVITTGAISQQAKEESDLHNVEIIDGDDLCSLIQKYDAEGTAYGYAKKN